MRISKRTREQAAIICSAMASLWGMRHAPWTWHVKDEVAHSLDAVDGADLAIAARETLSCEPGYSHGDIQYAEKWAEAQAMILTGWSP